VLAGRAAAALLAAGPAPAPARCLNPILYVGSPETVAQKIATNLRALGATRFDLKYGMPGLTHDQLMTNIDLYGRLVIPRVRELLS
jgi:alkanesulfonate monooxygenase SsuD/methylene tetrahydromethanopterin reductase-like flavin-dependent oxidoreductase (luciferase family)